MIGALNKSLSRYLFSRMAAVLLLVVIGGAVLVGYNQHSKLQYQGAIGEWRAKQEAVSAVGDHLDHLFFHARGYFAYQLPSDYEAIFTEKAELADALAAYRALPLNDSEKKLTAKIEQFVSVYYADYLPKGVQAVRKNDYDELRRLTASGIPNEANNLVQEASAASKAIDAQLKQAYEGLFESISNRDLLFLAYVAFLLLIYAWMAWLTSRNIGLPLRQLTDAAGKLAAGEYVELSVSGRKDEIGQISRAFQHMMQEIQTKEEELIAQNEELTAQQDELQMQQEDLQAALRKAEQNEMQLERRNRLVQSMSLAVNSEELLGSIIRGMVDLLEADKGLFVLLGDRKDHAAFGLSERAVEQCLAYLEEGPLQRVQETKQPYTIARPAAPSERGIHEQTWTAQDVYLPVLSAERDTVTALLILTFTAGPISPEREREAQSLAVQISLALERLRLYEESETQRRMTQEILDAIHEGVQFVDAQGLIRNANLSMYELFKEGRAAYVDRLPVERFYRFVEDKIERSHQLVGFMNDRINGGPSARGYEFLYEISRPERRMIHVYAEQIYRGEHRLGTVFVHSDITKEYEVDRMKSEFVSTVSHELRTPLSSVLGFAELLLTKELKPERQRKYLSMIHQEAMRLTGLINDFLDVQRMESGRQAYDKQRTDASAVIREVFDLLAATTEKHELRYEMNGEAPIILGDREKLVQVFTNLIGNAIKYSPHGGAITVSCSQTEREVAVSVSDEGLGIPTEAIPRLFTKFYRIDNSDRREIGGTGLGLAIVKEIVKAHGGNVHVASELGHGSTFTVTFPSFNIVAGDLPSLEHEYGNVPDKSSTVIIIEDDESLTELLENELRSQGFRVASFANGQEALEAIRARKPDAIVLDIMLKHSIDGWTILRELKEDEEVRDIPIFVSSALDEKETGRSLGATVYLVKPYPPSLLSQTIRDTLGEES
ncbi:hypothetical protein SD70_03925 [Gordoniibacillus kamchatkensis]|uniref:histidine kinase n=1 Tax=Gordoniibacillus kamchatkensis TaxID=1590651 RepID=A0ABR5ALX7_9BACL|nr:ATP-binding protein [Paenibacillus sp. VKM B-2647]KIL42009.1 hypothetical protein SD70_03925 [Paenibacillus sp. VKM B-2647]